MADLGFEIPLPFSVITGGEEERHIREQRDMFFERVLGSLGLSMSHDDSSIISVKERGLFFEGDVGYSGTPEPIHSRLYPTDDKFHELIVLDEFIAGVLDRRNDWNWHQVIFLAKPPSDVLKNTLASMMEARKQARARR